MISGLGNCTACTCTMSPMNVMDLPSLSTRKKLRPGVCPGVGTAVTPGASSVTPLKGLMRPKAR
jgi:hypothetical protein